MSLKLIALAGGLLLLAACSSPPPGPAPGPGPGPGAYGGLPPGGPGGVSSQAVPGSQEDLAQTAGDRVFFAFNRSDISPEAQQTLTRQAEWLRHYPNVAVRIEGHCDERGTREYNLALGARRAEAAKNVLVALGVPDTRIATISYGKDRPVVPGSDEAAWAQNRVAITTVQ
ncbi:MAG TPA: peptidoglycan-associated lipoprotein Pal [Stellaceae bacterium]|nr:peptidoglycan-associated lipoprotein Pal [Stellaceae bacterium]